MTLFGKKVTVVEKTAYEIGFSGTTEEIAARLHVDEIRATKYGVLPNDLFKGALDAAKEGRPQSFQTIVDHNMITAAALVAEAAEKGLTSAQIRDIIGHCDEDRVKRFLDSAVHCVIDRGFDSDKKIQILQTLHDAGADLTAFGNTALGVSITRLEQPLIDFLTEKGASVDDALESARKAKSEPHIAAILSYKMGIENAGLKAELEDLKKQYFDKVGERPKPFVAPKPTTPGNTGV